MPLSFLQGLMSDIGTAEVASQSFQQEQERTELGKLQILMEKKKIQQDEDTAQAMRTAYASDQMRKGGYQARIATWGGLHDRLMAKGNLSGAEAADREMKRLQDASLEEQKIADKQKTQMQEDAAFSARTYKAMRSAGQAVDPSYKQDVIEKVNQFDPQTADKLRRATPAQFDQMMDLIDKGAMTSNQINTEAERSMQFDSREKRRSDEFEKSLRQKEARIAELSKLRQSKQAAVAAGGENLVGLVKTGGAIGVKQKDSAMAAASRETGFTPTEVGEKYTRAVQLNSEIKAQETKNRPLESFHGTVTDNLREFKSAISKLKGGSDDPSDFRAFNAAYYGMQNAVGLATTQYADVLGKEVAGEMTKLMTTANATGSGGTLADREGWENLFRATQSGAQLDSVIRAVEVSLGNRMKNVHGTVDSMKQEMDDLWKRPGEKSTPKSEGSFTSGGKTITFKRID